MYGSTHKHHGAAPFLLAPRMFVSFFRKILFFDTVHSNKKGYPTSSFWYYFYLYSLLRKEWERAGRKLLQTSTKFITALVGTPREIFLDLSLSCEVSCGR